MTTLRTLSKAGLHEKKRKDTIFPKWWSRYNKSRPLWKPQTFRYPSLEINILIYMIWGITEQKTVIIKAWRIVFYDKITILKLAS